MAKFERIEKPYIQHRDGSNGENYSVDTILKWNKRHQQLLDNDQYLKDQKDDEGFSVVDGKLCVTYERED